MSEDLEAIQAAMKRLTESSSKSAEARDRALTVAMQGVQAALTELVALAESEPEEASTDFGPLVDRIVGAIRDLKLQAPDMELRPQISVAAPTVNVSPKLDVTVAAGPNHNHISVQPAAAEVHVLPPAGPATWTVDINYGRGGLPSSMTITRK
jgi:hypothetical protein